MRPAFLRTPSARRRRKTMMTQKAPLAVVTMLYNEADLLPIWIRHYAREAGPEHCFILDHGSTDGATEGLAVNVLKLPRSPFNEVGRAESCSRFCASLLYYYDRVLFTDVDEIVVVDPEIAPSLADYARQTNAPVINCFGMDLLHDEETEPPLQFEQPIMVQRHWVLPTSVLCKPTFVSTPVNWGIGFHDCDIKSCFGHLYLFHLAYADFGMIRRRQQKRNGVENLGPGSDHHRIDPDVFLQHIKEGYILNDRIDADLSRSGPLVEAAITTMLAGQATCDPERGLSSYRARELWRKPERYAALF